MPYIEKEKRVELVDILRAVDAVGVDSLSVGDINYLVSSIIHRWILSQGGVRYQHINSMIGALECAKLELYRKVAAPYEDNKLLDNGPISHLDSI